MSETSPEQKDVLLHRVTQALDGLSERLRRLRRTNTTLVVSGVLTSGLATLITGVTAATGPLLLEGIPGWRLACALGAVFSFGATVSVGLAQSLKVSERLAETRECSGRLRALEVALTTGSRPWRDVAMEYKQILKTYPHLAE